MSHATRNALYLASISQDLADSLAEIGVQMAGDHPLIAVDGRIEIDLDLDDDLDLDLDDDLDMSDGIVMLVDNDHDVDTTRYVV